MDKGVVVVIPLAKHDNIRVTQKLRSDNQWHIRADNNLQHFFNIVITVTTTINETTHHRRTRRRRWQSSVLTQRTMVQDQAANDAA